MVEEYTTALTSNLCDKLSYINIACWWNVRAAKPLAHLVDQAYASSPAKHFRPRLSTEMVISLYRLAPRHANRDQDGHGVLFLSASARCKQDALIVGCHTAPVLGSPDVSLTRDILSGATSDPCIAPASTAGRLPCTTSSVRSVSKTPEFCQQHYFLSCQKIIHHAIFSNHFCHGG